MQNVSRKLDQQSQHTQMERLEKRHWALKQQVAELDGQRFLTPSEQLALLELKKQKLATKDLLADLRGHVQSYDAE
jgi:hypothetical protein